MSNIPFIQRNRASDSLPFKRAKKVTSSEQSNDHAPKVQRRLDRRKNLNRRKKQINVRFDRRLRGNHRRKHLSIQQSAAETADLGNNIGTHINTSA